MKKLLCLVFLGVSLGASILDINKIKSKYDKGDFNACYELGWEYIIIQYYSKGEDLWRRACDNNNSLACRNLGGLYGNEFLPIHDTQKSREFYAKAKDMASKGCKNNKTDDCGILGLLYHYAQGVEQDYAKARELYTKACDGGVDFGCSRLGDLYYSGQGVKEDKTIAKEYYGKACDLGGFVGCSH